MANVLQSWLEILGIFSISRRFQVGDRDEAKSARVDTVANAGWSRPVGKHMTEVRVAILRANLGAGHTVGVIDFF